LNIDKLEKGQCVHLYWQDSATYGGGWCYSQPQPVPKEIETVGFVIDVSEDGVLVTSSHSESGGILAPLVVPATCIYKYKILEL
jgi:hypothetical protein